MQPYGYEQFKKLNINVASDLEAVVLLYNEAVVTLKRAQDNYIHKTGDFVKDIEYAQKIILALRSILDFKKGAEIAQNLYSLYSYFNSRLQVAKHGIRQTPAILDEVSGLLVKLKDAWVSIVPEPAKANSGTKIAVACASLDINV